MEISNNYNLLNDLELLKSTFSELKVEIDLFLKAPDKRKSGITARKKSKKIERLCRTMKKNVTKVRQDYKSDYS